MNTQHNEMMQALDVFTAERDRLREVNAELLAALQWAVKCVETGAWKNEDGETPDIEPTRVAIAKARAE